MANLSNAFGTIYLPQEYIEKVLVNEEKKYELWIKQFERTFGKTYEGVKIDNEGDFNLNGITLKFSGFGRWNFSNNIKWFNESFCRHLDIEDLIKKEENMEIEAMLFRWSSYCDCHIEFDFTDYDEGTEFLYQSTFKITRFGQEEIRYEDFDYNRDNLIRLGCACESDWVDIDELDETFIKDSLHSFSAKTSAQNIEALLIFLKKTFPGKVLDKNFIEYEIIHKMKELVKEK